MPVSPSIDFTYIILLSKSCIVLKPIKIIGLAFLVACITEMIVANGNGPVCNVRRIFLIASVVKKLYIF